MVVTRGHSKFKVGDQVLCQSEGDAQCCRSAKVVDVVDRGLVDGRRQIDFIVRVEDGSATHDRCVTEDELLETAGTDSSQIEVTATPTDTNACGANNRLKSSANSKPVQSGGQTDSDAAPSIPNADNSETSVLVTAVCQHSSIDGATTEYTASLSVPLLVRKWLENDHCLLNKQRKLLSLPARVTVCDILERYVHYWSTILVSASAGSASSTSATPTSTTGLPSSGSGRQRHSNSRDPWWQAAVLSHSLCVEVVDGIRILFDFVCQLQLLYKCERRQYGRLVMGGASGKRGGVSTDVGGNKAKRGGVSDTLIEKDTKRDLTQSLSSGVVTTSAVKRRSQRLSLLAQTLSTDPDDPVSADGDRPVVQSSESPEARGDTSSADKLSAPAGDSSDSLPFHPAVKLPRLQSRDSAVLDGDALPSGCCLLPAEERTKLPRQPCTVYGATHLLRLLVSLPNFLALMQLPEPRLKLVLHHGGLILDFITRCRHQWLTPDQYST